MIKNGLIEETNIYGVPFRQDLILVSNTIARPAIAMIPAYITVHNTGNSKKGADAEMHTKYVDTLKDYVSWHFTVDDKEIIQELPITENAWHAGDGRGWGNMRSIAIEICENEGIDWPKAKENGIKLIVYLLENVVTFEPGTVKPHWFWSGKYCPHLILDEGWEKFLALIDTYRAKLQKESVSQPEKQPMTLEEAVAFINSKGALNDVKGWIDKAKSVQYLDVLLIKIATVWKG